ncbi:uroporphyrinogen-III C-methyltransferase [Fusobacterium perfoetens]|uniref:uroporphyrinogen-III C-methyltransferase n=1 Tax=Fusobacterium perfoetens TaxID=852 RepID=UPI001F31A8F6|nr:uroporphyrinogen-III C-methyltransferase [Fusobacterium perfoetens]MCF2624836.1 uroporphyrinogen-III C-methyltransferase [Fusobacterium perfoetens]
MDKNTKGKVYVVGAGCGDFELLTLKGKRCIEEADCIIYDRLINKRILNFAGKRTEFIYLGKENTEGGLIQSEINNKIVEKALEGKTVVRLKGGDPFVFGRGGEEIEKIAENNIPFEIVPGITSAVAVPEYAGIPVTHRGISKSFHVFTGMTAKDNKFHDFEPIAKLDGTLIFLMGMKNLNLITKELIKYGKNPKTPTAVIEKGTTGKQRVITGTLENIFDIAEKEKAVSPAVIVIGNVVSKREEFKWFEKKDLFGKNILVTRDTAQGEVFCREIEKSGGNAELLSFLKIQDKMMNFDYSVLKNYQAVLFNSPNGVRFFFEHIPDMRVLGNIKIGAVGAKTKEELEKFKINPDVMPEKYLTADLAEEILKITEPNDRILIITSDISPCDDIEWSKKYNRRFEKFVGYNTIFNLKSKKEVEKILENVEYITFLSSSAVKSFITSLEKDISCVKNLKVISIGPSTSKTLKNFKINIFSEAIDYTADGVISILRKE